jgi:hypothetical protein
MTYHRASRKQLAFIRSLAEQTGATLPYAWEGYGQESAAKLIRSLQRQLANKVEAEGEPEQTSML